MGETSPVTAERWQQAKVIVADALEEKSPEARIALVSRRCEGDSGLRREVESLLAQTTSVFEECADKATAPLRRDMVLATGRRIGAYAIVRELGRGGMGAVYLANRADGEFEKQVAIKVLKRGTDTDEVLRRFRAEREILARLEHPFIARLFDGGTTEEGLPYFVMEYVAGLPVTDFCAAKAMVLEERLRLFLKICTSVQFAHQNLVVHRDLKPANVLITDEGEPKLLDFGIAKLLAPGDGAPAVTLYHEQRLTPAYASPEQVRGEPITTVSDVYALGALLYELLTGKNPHRFSKTHPSPTELLRVVGEEIPLRPSTVAADSGTVRRLRGDLDNIILKALRKEPARRYAGVDPFAEDIRRHLEDRPVRARKDTPSYRASKFMQRNKIGVAAGSFTLLTLVLGITATALEAHKARLEGAKAEQRFNEVRRLAHSVLFDYHDAIAALPGSTAVRERLVKDARDYLDNLSREAGNDRSLLRELATAYEKVGQIQGNSYFVNLGDTNGAMKSYRKSLTIREGLLAADPNNLEVKSELASSHEGVGDILYTIGDLRAGLKQYELALELRKNVFAANATQVANRLSLSELYARIGDIKGMEIYANLGDTSGALESYRDAEDLIESLSDANPQNNELRSTLTSVLMRVGMLSDTMGNVKNALEKERKAIALLEELAASFPNNKSYRMDLLEANSFLRYALVDNNQIPQAIENSRKTIATLQAISAADPKDISVQRDLGVVYDALGADLLTAGDIAGALENHRKALSISEALLTADPNSETNKSDVALTLQRLGEAQAAAQDFRSALENYRKALEIRQAILTADASNTRARNEISMIYADIGNALAATGDIQGADASFAQAIPLAEEVSAHSPTNAKLRARVALHYLEVGKLHEKIAQARGSSGANETTKWKIARDWLQRSLGIWQDMKSKETLSRLDAGKPDEVAQEIAHCDHALR
jgi:eukaryotic-like serine/threonine-protein kinase